MQDCVLNLCRVKMRDQQRLLQGPLKEYPNETFSDTVPRSGNASGGGQPGKALKCKGGGANDYAYVIIQPPGWGPLMKLVGREELITDSAFATPQARLSHLDECFEIIEQWTRQYDKLEVMRLLNGVNVPCGPIMSMKELIEDESLMTRGMVVEVEHAQRGAFRTVGCPLQLSDSPVEVTTSPGLGEHTNEILQDVVGYDSAEIAAARTAGAI